MRDDVLILTDADRRAPSPRRRLARLAGGAAAIALIAGATGLGVAALYQDAGARPRPAAAAPLPVATATYRLTDGYVQQTAYLGRIEAARSADLGFESPGLVTRVLVEEGDRVAAGQPIAQLDAATILAERASAVAEREQARAQLSLAQLTEDRQRRLVAQQVVSEQRHDDARFNAKALAARLGAIEARIAAIDIRLDKTGIEAPFAGVITARMIDEGDVAAAGAPAVRIRETARLQARIGVPPDAAEAFAPGDAARLRVAGREVAATLAARIPDLDPTTRSETLIFELAEGAAFPEGQTVELVAPRRIAARGGWVPLSALSEGRKGLWTVLTVAGDGRAARESVEVVALDGDRAFVRGTVRDGARIVAAGPNRIAPDQRVAPGAERIADAE